MEALDLPGGELVGGKVAAKPLLNAWAQDFDGDVAAALAIEHHRLVHLRDRGRGDGGAELGEMVLNRATQGVGHRHARLGDGERWQLVLQVPQVPGELGADQIGAGGQELPELDVAWTEAGERFGHARLLRLPTAERPRQQPDRQRGGACHMQQQGHAGALRHKTHAVLGQHDAGAGETKDVAQSRGHRDRANPCKQIKTNHRATLPQAGRGSSAPGRYSLRTTFGQDCRSPA